MNTVFFIIIMLIIVILMIGVIYYLGIKINNILKHYNINISNKMAALGTLIVCVIIFVYHSVFAGVIAYAIMMFVICDILKIIFRHLIKEGKVIGICRKIYRRGMLVIILALVITIYGAYNAKNLYVKEYQITIDKEMKEDINIIMISDIHAGTSVKEHQLDIMCDKINELKPDIVCLTGDIFDESSSDKIIKYTCDTFGKIKTKYGIYYVTGNHDADMISKFEDRFEENGVRIVDEEAVLINESFYLAGRKDRISGDRKNMDELLKETDDGYPVILLDHRPDDIDETKNSNVDLQLSGHTHNGQIFPFNFIVGIFNDAAYGYEKYNNYNIVISSGYGTWGFPIRTGSKAEIVKVLLQGRK